MSENFADLFEESLQTVELNPGDILTGVIIDVDKDLPTVHACLKSEVFFPAETFFTYKGEISVPAGSVAQVTMESVDDVFCV